MLVRTLLEIARVLMAAMVLLFVLALSTGLETMRPDHAWLSFVCAVSGLYALVKTGGA